MFQYLSGELKSGFFQAWSGFKVSSSLDEIWTKARKPLKRIAELDRHQAWRCPVQIHMTSPQVNVFGLSMWKCFRDVQVEKFYDEHNSLLMEEFIFLSLRRGEKRGVQTPINKGSISLEGLQVFGHGVGFYFYKGVGGVSFILFGRLAEPWISTPKSSATPSPPNQTTHPLGSNSDKWADSAERETCPKPSLSLLKRSCNIWLFLLITANSPNLISWKTMQYCFEKLHRKIIAEVGAVGDPCTALWLQYG